MLSRVAENLYWMARYLERAENTARFINSVTLMLLDLPRGASFGWDVLLKAAGLDELYAWHHDTADEDAIMQFLIADEHNPSSIVASVQRARDNARTFREVLPMEIWERINALHLFVREQAPAAWCGRRARWEMLNGVIERQQSVVGLLEGSMSRDLAWQFIALGRQLERADMTTRILDVNSAVRLPDDPAGAQMARERLWLCTLNALSALQMVRQHVGVRVQPEAVLRYLTLDARFPRAVAHCLGELETGLAQLPDFQGPLAVARALWRRLRALERDEAALGALHARMDGIQRDLAALHDALARQYFWRHQAPAAA
ncbi:hypothetical protein Tsedi_00489 [Tepidimonas sediminis]|uniref:DUF403 domain-containing protein n=1 Tax=Tepidimonas sediminis TaxID=2588941 RepID=A0A554WT72_9BURK|nr:alpha-E domain-containing protein [Tepidimonas sediminis]TSE26781.1 hypothetical protein Tsedi_00489 [Tepidimonas sediminis]